VELYKEHKKKTREAIQPVFTHLVEKTGNEAQHWRKFVLIAGALWLPSIAMPHFFAYLHRTFSTAHWAVTFVLLGTSKLVPRIPY
jgi:hypothetical protein